MPDIQKLAGEVFEAVRGYVAAAFGPLKERVAALERAVKDIPVGNDGAPGKDGRDGALGKDGERGEQGKPGMDGADGKDGAPGKDGADGAEGATGKAGLDGERGERGDAGAKGEKGDAGERGPAGESIKGERGEKGDPGDRGQNGADGECGERGAPGLPGKSAYQLAVERGFAGTELQWLDAMQGRPGKDADPAVTVAMIEAIEAKAPRQWLHDMVDELSRGLAGFDDLSEATPTPALQDLAESVSELNKTMRLPIEPVYGPDGKTIVAAKRG